MPTFNPYDRKHLQNVARYQRMIEEIYAQAAKEAAQIAASIRGVDTETPFRFEDYPQTRKKVDALMRSLQSQIQVTVVNGINSEWTLANNKNNELANRVFGDNVGRLSQSAYRRYYSTNDYARQAFQQRKVNGLSLSDRVWRYTDQFKEEIEMGLDVGIRSGLSADQMTRDLKQYLRHPDKLFRRVRDERGQLHLSKAAAAFHPGRGVYRSSYMNARRLAGTEANIAYRTSDYTRWQQMDFVVGIEVRLSPTNHTCKGKDGNPHPFKDICDELAGRYPKDFKFTGWHPHCRCHAVSILKTQKEIAEDTKKILKGETPDSTSVNEVKDVPPQFKEWVQNNAARMVKGQSLPYFMSDNPQYVGEAFGETQSHTRIAQTLGMSGVFDYATQFSSRNPKVAALLDQLDDNAPTSDIERAMLLSQLKKECANMTYADLEKWGAVDDSFVLSRVQTNLPINPKCTFIDSNGNTQTIKENVRDVLIFKDKNGREFAYPVGIPQEKVSISAVDASRIIETFPPYLKKGIERVSFYNEECPMDLFWKSEYKNPKHKSMATDGGKTDFWMAVTKDNFKPFMAHEAAHILDGKLKEISASAGWKAAVDADLDFWTIPSSGKRPEGWGYVSKYAMTNNVEDFAESMREYITNHDEFKQNYPNRAAFIRQMAQRLSKRIGL